MWAGGFVRFQYVPNATQGHNWKRVGKTDRHSPPARLWRSVKGNCWLRIGPGPPSHDSHVSMPCSCNSFTACRMPGSICPGTERDDGGWWFSGVAATTDRTVYGIRPRIFGLISTSGVRFSLVFFCFLTM